MSEEFWPHKFTKNGAPKQVGEKHIYDNTVVPVMEQEMICVCCHTTFVHNRDPQPTGGCPARSTKSEMKRLLNK